MQKNLSANEGIRRLREGNKRYVEGVTSLYSLTSPLARRELVEKGQSPFCIVLTCSDSRVPVETVFDQGLGDIFVIRVAGNVLAPALLASIEFAAINLGTTLCVVMGHSHCGALKAAIEVETTKAIPATEHLKALMDKVVPAVRYALQHNKNATPLELTQEAVRQNVINSGREILKESAALKTLHASGNFVVANAVYDLESGVVEFLAS